MGAIAGVMLSIHYRKTGPRAQVYDWGEDEEEEVEAEVEGEAEVEAEVKGEIETEAEAEVKAEVPPAAIGERTILYHYKPKKD